MIFRDQIRYFIWVAVLGAGLVAYAHANFITKPVFNLIYDEIKSIKSDVKDIRNYLLEKND